MVKVLLRIFFGCIIVVLLYLGNGFFLFTENLGFLNTLLLFVALVILEVLLMVIFDGVKVDRESKKEE